MAVSRMERLIKLIGEENLPPRLPTPPEPAPASVMEEEDDELDYTPVPRNFRPPFANSITEIPQRRAPTAARLPTAQGEYLFDERKGAPAPLGINFCPFVAVTKFCYKFVEAELVQPLATAFFDAGKIYERDWDLYYIASDYNGVTTFITQHQLQALLDEINEKFSNAKFSSKTDLYREKGLVIDFEHLESRYRPRWLGRSTSRAQIDSWTHRIDSESNMRVTGVSRPDRSLEAFKAKMDLAAEAARNKSKNKKKAQLKKAVETRQTMVSQTLRAQRYLGLLPKNEGLFLPDKAESMPVVDISVPAPHPFDMDVIFIAIDIEARERPPHHITEIGVATLDTRDLKDTAPGKVGTDWHKAIRGRHLRIDEYKDWCNRDFVQGCPEDFEFGKSEFVPKDEVGRVLASCFHEPFSKQIGKLDFKADDFPPLGTPPSTSQDRVTPEKRNLVIVGHDLSQDIAYCHQIGFSILNRSNILDTNDTASMFRAYTKDPHARSLGSMMYHFDLVAWHLHNAGNDAVYTLQALLAICVQAASERGSAEAKGRQEAALERKMEAAVLTVKERAEEDAYGWDSIPGDDGGVPLPATDEDYVNKRKVGKGLGKPTFGPVRPGTLYTVGGAILDV